MGSEQALEVVLLHVCEDLHAAVSQRKLNVVVLQLVLVFRGSSVHRDVLQLGAAIRLGVLWRDLMRDVADIHIVDGEAVKANPLVDQIGGNKLQALE